MPKKNIKKKEVLKPSSNSLWAYISFAVIVFISLKGYFSNPAHTFSLSDFFNIISPEQYLSFKFLSIIKTHIWNLFLSLFVVLSIFSFGDIIYKILKLDSENKIEKIIYSYASGFILLIIFVMLFGFLGYLYKKLFLFFSISGILIYLFLRYKNKTTSDKNNVLVEDFYKFPLLYFFLSILFFIALIQSLSPETFYDTIIYHLAVPNYWIINGKIADLPNNVFSKMPFNHGIVYLYAMLIGNEITAKMVNLSFSLFSVFSIIFLFRKYYKPETLIVASIIFFSIFHVANVSWYASTDSMITFFAIVSFHSILKYKESASLKWLILSALFSSISMGTKFTSIFYVAGIISVYFYGSKKEDMLINLKRFAIFCFFASIFVLPWLIKDLIKYSNPFYPMLYKIFNPDLSKLEIDMLKNWMGEVSYFTLHDWLLHPFYISIGRIANSEFFTPLFLCILPLALFNKDKRDINKILWLFLLVSWLFWSLITSVIRFLMPAYFAASLLASFYINEAFDGLFRKILKIFLAFTIFMSLNWILVSFYIEEKWKYFFGVYTQDEYLSYTRARYPYPSYAIIKYINENLPNNSKVIFLGEAKTLYMKKKFEASTVYDRNIFLDEVIDSKNIEELYNSLKNKGFTHILFNISECIRNNMTYKILYLNKDEIIKFHNFFDKYMQEEKYFDDISNGRIINRVILYKITEKKNKPSPDYIYEAWLKSSKV
jgi:hypothetical protein